MQKGGLTWYLLIAVLPPAEAIAYLISDGVNPENAFLAVRAAVILQKDRSR